MQKILISVLLLLFFQHSHAQEGKQLALSDVLQSNMVLQQNKPFKIWGTANKNEQVSIQADWMKAPLITSSDEEGKFMGIIMIPSAIKGDFSKHSIHVRTGQENIALENLLIGDLWFLSGQSNMQFALKEMLDSTREIAAANLPHIRLFNAGLNFSAEPIENISGKWVECSPKTAAGFSAVGYSFGKELYEELDIPIGLIFSGIGASAAQAFVPQVVLAKDTMLNRVYLQPYLQSERSKEKIDGGFTFEKVTRPFLLYNAMIHPLRNLSIKGFCWYQGESNRSERASYTHLTQELIRSWRKNFSQDNLPFYYVQVAPFFYDQEDPTLADYAFFREAQENIASLENTAMVVTMDVGESKDLHPKNKKPIGHRLARTALNRTYGQLNIAYQGPQYKYLEIKGNKAIVHFCETGTEQGLNTKDGSAPKHFEIAGTDQKFFPASAIIDGKTIIVHSSKVKKPVAVRYAFTNYPVTNLQNKEGFPVVPFRTDNWKE